MKIGTHTAAEGQPVFVIAEMAWAHDGKREKAKKIIEGAAKAGASAISVHITSLPNYMVRSYQAGKGNVSGERTGSLYSYLETIQIDMKIWNELLPYAKSLGLAVVVMCNDLQSLQDIRAVDPDAYVLAAACFLEEEFVRQTARAGKPVILRIGGATVAEIQNVIRQIKEAGNNDILLLHGFQNYPSALEDTQIQRLAALKEGLNVLVGLAEHIDGGDELALAIPLLSLPLGVVAIEKHITWDRNEKGEDYESALDPAAFAKFVSWVRAAEKALGQKVLDAPFTASEANYRKVVRKRAVARVRISASEPITPEMVAFKRSDTGLYPDEIKALFGRRLRQTLEPDEPITAELVKE